MMGLIPVAVIAPVPDVLMTNSFNEKIIKDLGIYIKPNRLFALEMRDHLRKKKW